MVATEDFMSDSNESVQLKEGQRGSFGKEDADGDWYIYFEDHAKPQWVKSRNTWKLRVWVAREVPSAPPLPQAPGSAHVPEAEKEARECPVCLDELRDPAGAGATILAPCGHTLCSDCAKQFAAGAKCPVCRADVAAQVKRVYS